MQENRQPNANGPTPKPNRKPDFDFTADDDNAVPRISKIFWPDKYSFKDALFSALSDADDAEHWARVFGSEIHIYPRPRPNMTDDEYATWVREQVYSNVLRENHRKKIEGERLRQEARMRQQKEEQERRFYENQKKKEQDLRSRNAMGANGTHSQDSSERNLRSQAPLQRWKDYLAAFQPPAPDADLDLLLLWQQSDVPWPTPTGLEKDISEASIRTFVKMYTLKYSEQAGGDWKKAVKQNQYYWHPDKFQQIQVRKLERLTEAKKDAIMKRVTEVSQILNKLAKE